MCKAVFGGGRGSSLFLGVFFLVCTLLTFPCGICPHTCRLRTVWLSLSEKGKCHDSDSVLCLLDNLEKKIYYCNSWSFLFVFVFCESIWNCWFLFVPVWIRPSLALAGCPSCLCLSLFLSLNIGSIKRSVFSLVLNFPPVSLLSFTFCLCCWPFLSEIIL